jgi:altronate hydrolase
MQIAAREAKGNQAMTVSTIRLNAIDNVIVARMELQPGMEIPEEGVVCKDRIPIGHKLATNNIQAGEAVRKYGQTIGFATNNISRGQHIHTQNLAIREFERDYASGTEMKLTETALESERTSFKGYVRANGRVGTRNHIAVLPTVNCSASASHHIADAIRKDVLANNPKIDGVIALSHEGGCSAGEGNEILQRVLTGYARHPNFAGVLLVGLGCEVNQVDELSVKMQLERDLNLQSLTIQESGGTKTTVSEGVARVREMIQEANRIERQRVSTEHIILGLECGGSDAYSGISANPALGVAVDKLVQHGGTAILSETPEIYGAEHLLTRRAASREIGQELVSYIRWWKDHTAQLEHHLDNNPTPGNKAGGITTILEKSLGAVAKGGSTNLMKVLQYGEPVKERGLVFMDTPGYDPVSVTGMVAGGANVVCFTTGRGSVFGCKPVPSIKIATNTAMYRHMVDDMDINCGMIVDGQSTIEQMGEQIFQLILDTASGKQTKSEAMGIGDYEFVPWSIGPVL